MEGENEDLLRTINEFLKFENGYDIKEIHCLIGKDLDFAQLDLQYKELSKSSEEIKHQPLPQLVKYFLEPSRKIYYD